MAWKEKLTTFLGTQPMYTKTALCVHVVWMFYSSGFHLLLPVIPFLLSDLAGVGETETVGVAYGWFKSIKHLMSVVGAPVAGYCADRWGTKFVLLMSLCAAMTYFALYACSFSLWMLFAAQVSVVFQHAKQATQTYLVHMSAIQKQKNNKGTVAVGRLTLASGLSRLALAAVGGAAVNQLGMRNVAWLACGLVALVFPLACCLPPMHRTTTGQKGKQTGKFWELLRNRDIQMLLVFMFLWRLGNSMVLSMEQVILKEQLGFSISKLGIFGTLFGLGKIFLTGLIVPHLSHWLHNDMLLCCGCLLSTLCLGLFMLNPAWYMLLTVAKVSTLSLTRLLFVTSISTLCGTDNLGASIGLAHAALSVTGIVSPLLGGFVYNKFGVQTLVACGLCCTTLAWVYWIVVLKVCNKKPKQV